MIIFFTVQVKFFQYFVVLFSLCVPQITSQIDFLHYTLIYHSICLIIRR